MGERITGGETGSVFGADPDRLMESVVKDMVVVDQAGARVGKVEFVQLGDPEAITTEGEETEPHDLISDVVRTFVDEPSVPEPLRSQLIRNGYIKVHEPGLTHPALYVRGDYVAAVTGDTVTLTVAKDQLIAHR